MKGIKKMTNPLRMDMKKGVVELEDGDELTDEEIFQDDKSDEKQQQNSNSKFHR